MPLQKIGMGPDGVMDRKMYPRCGIMSVDKALWKYVDYINALIDQINEMELLLNHVSIVSSDNRMILKNLCKKLNIDIDELTPIHQQPTHESPAPVSEESQTSKLEESLPDVEDVPPAPEPIDDTVTEGVPIDDDNPLGEDEQEMDLAKIEIVSSAPELGIPAKPVVKPDAAKGKQMAKIPLNLTTINKGNKLMLTVMCEQNDISLKGDETNEYMRGELRKKL